MGFIAGICLLLVEFGVFRSGLYFQVVEPNSYCGQVVNVLRGARVFQDEAGEAERVLVLGDSRMAEGFSSRLSDELGPRDLRWFNASVAGSTPRVWSYLLETMRRQGIRFDFVVVSVQSLAGRATEYGIADRVLDGQFMPPILPLPETLDFARSFPSSPLRWKMLFQGLVSSYALRNDVIHLLSNPAKRLDVAARTREAFRSHYAYSGRSGNLVGKVWVAEGRPAFSSEITAGGRWEFESQCKLYSEEVRPEDRTYQREWIGRLERSCRAAGATLVVALTPRGPLGECYDPENRVDGHACLGLAPDTVILPAGAFSGLEKPEYFFDHFHMNSDGRREFSTLLLKYVSGIAAVPSTTGESASTAGIDQGERD
ncbi:MAG TPA: hypothetical protein PK636_06655 [bacterium]|nr:hypothetical protein [bacterium]